jgi:hypothetical protein
MRLICSVLLATSLAASLIAGQSAARANSLTVSQHRVPSPVVIEWFSQPMTTVGQREVVYFRLLDRNQALPGARLTAHVQLGKTVVMVLRGSTIDRTGRASTSFTVPASARGKVLRVVVSLAYRQYHFPGRNDLRVRK